MKHLWIALAVWNIITFIFMGADKFQAKRDGARISEKTLILISFAMGAGGTCVGALIFHHKTRKAKFRILLPLAAGLNLAVIGLVIYQFVIQ